MRSTQLEGLCCPFNAGFVLWCNPSISNEIAGAVCDFGITAALQHLVPDVGSSCKVAIQERSPPCPAAPLFGFMILQLLAGVLEISDENLRSGVHRLSPGNTRSHGLRTNNGSLVQSPAVAPAQTPLASLLPFTAVILTCINGDYAHRIL